jgi:hypothetical protein
MAFLLYLFVLLVSAASVMFGLDLMTSPLPSTPNVPIGRSVRHAAQEPAAPQIKKAEQQTAKEQQLADRALTPIYPASPGPSAPMQTSGAAAVEPTPVEPAQAQPSAASAAPAQQTQAQPASIESPHCDVRACSNAYRSFSAADCTYQPLAGPRRLCEKSAEATIVAVPTPQPAPKQQPVAFSPSKQPQLARKKSGKDELAEVVRIVKQRQAAPGKPLSLHPPQATASSPEMSEAERIVRKMTRGRYAGDIPVIDGSGRVIVVRTGEARAQAYRGE